MYYLYSAVSAPSMKLMFVGLSGRGKTTLLNSLRFTGKVKTKPITIRERLDSESLEDSSGTYVCIPGTGGWLS